MIPTEAIIDELASRGKQAVLEEMVGVLVGAGRIAKDSAASVVKALMKREELGSTGIGKGVAVPHAKHESIAEPVAAFGRSSKGIEFAALDGQPVRLVFLLLSSKENSGQHLEALAGVARLVKDDQFCRFLRRAKGREGLAELLAEADSRPDDAARAAPAG
jgi:mannitol/fructose-specific phosphotransferase system IIA component (Ntr-type)